MNELMNVCESLKAGELLRGFGNDLSVKVAPGDHLGGLFVVVLGGGDVLQHDIGVASPQQVLDEGRITFSLCLSCKKRERGREEGRKEAVCKRQ